ncbi:MAG: hypothetical protein ACI8PZ_000235 [Myxococcota bacterium]|jgi:hypothetical protein
MRMFAVTGLALVLTTGCAYRPSDYGDGEGSAVCITTDRLANRIQGDWTGVIEPVEEVFELDEKVWVNVVFHHAVGKDCDRIVASDCSLGFNGTEVDITASAQWEYARNRERCDGPIEPLVASCQTVGLDEETWTFVYGDMDLVIDVPSTVETPCLDLDTTGGCSTAPAAGGGFGVLLTLLALRRRRA